MAKTDFRSVDEYVAAQPRDVQVILRQVRSIIRKAVPGAVEFVSYQMPAFKIVEGPFLCLGGWKRHYSLYPANDTLVAAFKGALTPYKFSRGTLRFPWSEAVPAKLIARIAKFRAKEVARKAKARRALRKGPMRNPLLRER